MLAAGTFLGVALSACATCDHSNSAASCFSTSTSVNGSAVTVTTTFNASGSAGYYLRTVEPGNGDAAQCDYRFYSAIFSVNQNTFTFPNTPGLIHIDYDS